MPLIIKIQILLTAEELKEAISYANFFINEYKTHNKSWRHLSRGGHPNGLSIQRNKFGRLFSTKHNLVFRRISKNKPIFAIIKSHHLTLVDGSAINLNQCICGNHLGGIKVKTLKQPEMFVFYEDLKNDNQNIL